MAELAVRKTVEFFGETFTLMAEPSQWALMEFAEAASAGEDGDTMEGLASTLRLVQACIVDEDLGRFKMTARVKRAQMPDLVKILEAAFDTAERPTGLSSDSSDGQHTIEPKPVVNSDDKASAIFTGRPDLQLAVANIRQTA